MSRLISETACFVGCCAFPLLFAYAFAGMIQ